VTKEGLIFDGQVANYQIGILPFYPDGIPAQNLKKKLPRMYPFQKIKAPSWLSCFASCKAVTKI
jgi:hypothetical protein